MAKHIEISDSELIKAVRLGNQGAFKVLVERYQNIVAATCMSMLKDYNDAEEVGQKVFIQFYKKIDQFKGDSSLKTYLTKIAMNFSLNEIKRRERDWSRKTPLLDVVHHSIDTERSKENKELLRLALNYLEPSQRALVVLRGIQGFGAQEAADILEIPLGTALSRYSRALTKLKEIITRLENGRTEID